MSLKRHLLHAPAVLAVFIVTLVAPPQVAAAESCHATSGSRTVPLVELFTSEGCDSCPPADRWLSAQFPPRSETALALAFHVDYWDRLGWRDRFASAQFTQRQRDEARAGGAAFVYTPQFLVQGRDTPGWNRGAVSEAIAAAERRPPRAVIALDVTPEAGWLSLHATATVADAAGRRNADLWIAFADSGHVTEVAAGENRGARLRHDHVVRSLHGPFPVGAGGIGGTTLTIPLPQPPGSASTVVAFVQDAVRGDILQALALAECR
jgi:hypothetical protein